MDRDPYSEYNDYIKKRRDGLSERKVENMIKEEIAKNKPKIGWLKALTIFLLIYSLVMSYFVAKNMTGITETINKNGQVESSTISIKNNSVSTENAVAKKSLDSVVGITTVGVQENMFFQGRVVEGVGSGVVVSKDGYILTNAHVVQDGKAEKIEVLLTNGKKSSAKLLWYDTTLDLAVIKTDLTGLKPVEMGDSDKVQIGDKAIAIGNPLGLDLQSTLTSGYISGKDRTITLQNGLQMDGLMQTDAAINSGNSGGGLFDQEGKLIGINTAKASAEGIGFTIPINVAKTIVDNIVSGGSFEGVKLGISGVDVKTFQQATGQKLSIDKGIYVVEVVRESSAQKAGVTRGDIITKVNGKEINTMSSLKKALLEVRPQQKGKITVYRDGNTKDLDIEFSTLQQK
ncbi:MAG: trypsin-like peptidase domain-containing protein [Finegoldia magna]|uniref:S1C family serine protease n=1 Tax=Finegoldia TaxID=150022 RepID=UPI0012B04265|nr:MULTISPECIES: trypsin-like peptidase domain-containing protein [Finegoldia]MBS5360383.1 trypsin-like peptidase domain-containing protein [Finegoldia magna]MDU2639665.1 trypsin-like peptidase domain-containing protein [Finegoldia magna]MDU5214095.1 trypsin-like peptidase domain-containing protein [Finegoldia magna]MDU5587683.1 trypsin-like peptidase domain-containing protein [Finegoldia magna]MDU5699338.1 trypsin-like peptidase domain-containing protein [Finegoldia magna]